jgi:hypothetical protein
VHITPPDIIKDRKKYEKKEPYFSLLSNSKVNAFATAEDAAAMLESEDFDRAVVFGFAFCDIGLCRYVNDYVIEKKNKFADKLTGFAVVPPGDGRRGLEAAKEIERCYAAGLKGVGELFPAGQKFNLQSQKETMALAGVCKELSLPLLLHVNELVGHDYPGKTDIPMRHIETFISNNPEISVILAHFGGGIFLYETMKEIKEKFRNVYYDTAIMPFLYDERIYNVVKALGLCEKIIFGSDFPVLSPSRYKNALDKCGFSNEEKQLVLGENAKRLIN